MAKFDNNLVVVGGGSAGLIAALIGATVKAKVTLVEKGEMGGDCLNTGCVPSKALIQTAKIAHYHRIAADFGIKASEPEVDFAAVMDRVRGAIATIAPKDSMERYRSLGVDCIAGEAVFEDPHTIKVGNQQVNGRSMVIASGATPFVPGIPGLADAQPLTSDNLWRLNELPKRLMVMGGGPIGCELAQSFARLGSKVTIIDMADRLLPREDVEVSAHLADTLKREGVDVLVNYRATQVNANNLKAVTPTEEVELQFDQVLVAVGRAAHSRGMGLEEIGVQTNPNGTLVVDDYLRTTVSNIFGCGDVVGPYQFTHMASHQAWFAAVNGLYGRFKKFKVDYSVVPWTTFTDPEIARVGLSEADALEQGLEVEVTRYDFDDLDRAIADGATTGWVKILTRPGSDKILGATIVAPHAGELMSELVLAMTHGLGLKKVMGTIHMYPTLSEANKMVAGAWRRKNAPERLIGWVERFNSILR